MRSSPGRKRDGQEEVVGLGPRVARVLGAQLLPRAARARRAVVPVGDVEARHAAERVGEPRADASAESRQIVCATPSGAVKSKSGALRFASATSRVDLGRVAVGQEDGPGLGAEAPHVACPVVLLVLPRALVLADPVARRIRRSRRTRRRPSARGRPSGAGRRRARRRPPGRAARRGAGSRSSRAAFSYTAFGEWIGAVGQVDLRARDVQEGERIARRRARAPPTVETTS